MTKSPLERILSAWEGLTAEHQDTVVRVAEALAKPEMKATTVAPEGHHKGPRRCPDCARVNPEEASYCPECGCMQAPPTPATKATSPALKRARPVEVAIQPKGPRPVAPKWGSLD